jgi:hypothetical protein
MPRDPSPDSITPARVDTVDLEATKVAALRAAIDEGDAAPDADDHSLQGILAEAKWLAYAREAVRDGEADLVAGRATDMNAEAFSAWLRALPSEPT